MQQKNIVFLLRIALGWIFFYAGITKVLNPAWSAEAFLKGAKTFSDFYISLIGYLPTINFVNKWSLTLLGISLILGIFVRLSSVLGATLMVLYYLPALNFPMASTNYYLVDYHIIFILLLLYFTSIKAGRINGMEKDITDSIYKKYPKLKDYLG
ncbi:MAG: DoxX family protein [Patescibacteria group bacterium]|mgnify:CR=1 FL=1